MICIISGPFEKFDAHRHVGSGHVGVTRELWGLPLRAGFNDAIGRRVAGQTVGARDGDTYCHL